ncbi:MAG TPA: 16S rRNA (guanine(527)-N(7))-methyltransferase RsmG [Candidatus Binatia bacterium]|nr:16S rRNA (guanine(527)-N(7))-methyltransferase RsmG [Candidatus Binatia bacterium]
MDSARIGELLQPFLAEQKLEAANLIHISTYIDLLLRWNARVNLTAIRDTEQIVTRHFGESLFAARQLFPGRIEKGQVHLADIGSGAGFPGIPIKLWEPRIELMLVESNHKKAAFLRELVRTLGLTGVTVQNVRAETMLAGSFDVVTLRAVERFSDALPTANRLLAPKGRMALLIGSGQVSTAREVLPGLDWDDPVPVPLSESRVVLMSKREP